MLGTLLFLGVLSFLGGGDQPSDLSFSEFRHKVAAGQVQNAQIMDGDQVVSGKLTDDSSYRSTFPTDYADDLAIELDKAQVPTDVDPQRPNALLGTLITVILPVLLIGGIRPG